MTTIHITPEDNVQERIDSTQVGDTVKFEGVFHLEDPLIFWSNRDYDGQGSVFHVKRGGIEVRERPGERKAKTIALWLRNHLYLHTRDPRDFYQDEYLEEEDLPQSPLLERLKRWGSSLLLSLVHHIFWFPRGSMISGFALMGQGQGTAIRVRQEPEAE